MGSILIRFVAEQTADANRTAETVEATQRGAPARNRPLDTDGRSASLFYRHLYRWERTPVMTAVALRERLQRVPADVLGVLVAVVLTHAFVFHPALSGSPLRVVVGVPFVLFVPGYALVAAIFPEEGTSPTAGGDGEDGTGPSWTGTAVDSFRGIDRWERVALAFGLSLAVVPLVAMVVTLSPLGFGAATVLPAVGAFSTLCAVVAAVRRRSLSPQRRFSVSPLGWVARTRRSFVHSDSRGELLLSTGLVIVVVLAVGTFGFAVLAPPDGETYTEFYVLTENAEGDLVTADYPDSVSPGEPQPLSIGIENYEEETVDYEVVIQLQRVDGTGTDAGVTERTRIDRYAATLDHNETQVDERNVVAPDGWTGTDLRLEFLLYEGAVPETPTRENAHRSLHIWIDVGPERNATAADNPTATPDAQNATATPDTQNTTATPDAQNATATPDAQNTTAAAAAPSVAPAW